MEKKHYGTIDGLRTIAAIGIVMTHVKLNNQYHISGFFYNTVIKSLWDFTYLFMTVSAFSMCCGYYEKILHNGISISDFYRRRFRKIWPFYAVLVLLDFALSPTLRALYETFADLTLMFGFLPYPRDIAVIGVGWFLGLIFVFYLIFPFFCFLLENKRRAWGAFAVSIAYNYVGAVYFKIEKANILYSACFFLAGGLIYLYKDDLEHFSEKHRSFRWVVLAMAAVSAAVYYTVGEYSMPALMISVTLLIYAIVSHSRILENRFTKAFSSISMEIYLAHMVIFRGLEKLHLNTFLGDGWLQYIVNVVSVLICTAVFAVIMQKVLAWISNHVLQKRRGRL